MIRTVLSDYPGQEPMFNDDTLRFAIAITVGVIFILALLGGLVTRAAGEWRDNERVIRLEQLGPFLWGSAEVPGGESLYRGFALFRLVFLSRRDLGREHLLAMGFQKEAVGQISGSVTARFSFKVSHNMLNGTFRGMHFRFDGEPPKLAGYTLTEPAERVWRRVA